MLVYVIFNFDKAKEVCEGSVGNSNLIKQHLESIKLFQNIF